MKCWDSGVFLWGSETRNCGAGGSQLGLASLGKRLSAGPVPCPLLILTARGSGAGCFASHHLGREDEDRELEPGARSPGWMADLPTMSQHKGDTPPCHSELSESWGESLVAFDLNGSLLCRRNS